MLLILISRPGAIELASALGRRLLESTKDYFRQRIDMAVQRGNTLLFGFLRITLVGLVGFTCSFVLAMFACSSFTEFVV